MQTAALQKLGVKIWEPHQMITSIILDFTDKNAEARRGSLAGPTLKVSNSQKALAPLRLAAGRGLSASDYSASACRFPENLL